MKKAAGKIYINPLGQKYSPCFSCNKLTKKIKPRCTSK